METVSLIVMILALVYAAYCSVSVAIKVKKAGKGNSAFRLSWKKVLFKGSGAVLWGMLSVHQKIDGNPGWMSSFGMALFLVVDLIEESIEKKK